MKGDFYKGRFIQLKVLTFILRLCVSFALKLHLVFTYLFYKMVLRRFF